MKKVLLTLLVLYICMLCYAEEFMIGAYCLFDLWTQGAINNRESLKNYLVDGGFNTSTISHKESLTDAYKIETILETFGDDIGMILSDYSWSANDVSIHELAYGNFLRMEAEYMLKYQTINGNKVFIPDDLVTQLDPTGKGEVYNYVFEHAVGFREREEGTHSNEFAWVCDEDLGHIAGLALSNPRFRWKMRSTHTHPRSIGYDFKFHDAAIVGNRLYLTVAMKFDPSSLDPNEEVASIKLKILKQGEIPDAFEAQDYTKYVVDHYYDLTLTPVNPAVSTTISNIDYSGVPIDVESGNKYLFEYYAEFPQVGSIQYQLLMRHDSAGDYFLHINPEIYWSGKGRMELDYITIEDEYHRQLRKEGTSSAVFNRLKNRVDGILALQNSSNIRYYMSKDEPYQGQFSMYKQLEEKLMSHYGANYPKMITAIAPLQYYSKKDANGLNYKHFLNFLEQAKPKTIALDAYPLQPDPTFITHFIWNTDTDSLSVQNLINRIVTQSYKSLVKGVRFNTDINLRDTEIVYIPQIFGQYLADSSGNLQTWIFIKPPKSMIKCLQLLPLCYDADGILDFTLITRGDEGVKKILTPLTSDEDYANIRDKEKLDHPDEPSSFELLTEANRKIAIYGKKIKKLAWQDADCLMTYGGAEGVYLSPFLLQGNSVLDPMATPPPYYTGHVQCGYYLDNQFSPSFMLVNRRAVYKIDDNAEISVYVNGDFVDAESQYTVFQPSPSANTHFGTHIGLYDPYDSAIYKASNGEISVEIGPGDGKLLQMCSTLPATVNSDATLKTLAHIAGNITIDDSAFVNILPGTETWILNNSVITINGGSRLKISGTVCIGDSVQIIAEEGGILEIDASSCEWGCDARVTIDGGCLIVGSGSLSFGDGSSINAVANSTVILDSVSCSMGSGSILECYDSSLQIVNSTIGTVAGVVWNGLRAERGTVVLDNSTISNAESNRMSDVSLISENCIFNVPENSLGLYLSCYSSNNSSVITATQEGKGFFGEGENNFGIGIDHSSSYTGNTLVKNIEFRNLSWGFLNWTTAAISDTIKDCTFVECQIGIDLQGTSYNPWILASDFISCQKGILLEATSPRIHDCDFDTCQIGILAESTVSPEGEIRRCEFLDNGNNINPPVGIESRGSNIRIANNDFYDIHTAILCHAGSNLNLGNNAKNKLKADSYNIRFLDNAANYRSTIQVYTGHNDFYHTDPGLTRTDDYSFDENYYVVVPPKSRAFDGSYNWYGNSLARIECPSPYPDSYVKVLYYDPEPNVPIFPEEERMAVALGFENENQHENAKLLYKAILDEDLDAESKFLLEAIDGFYRTSHKLETPSEVVETYLQSKIVQYEAVDYNVVSFLKDYLVKQYLSKKDFQAAIDVIQARLDNPSSPIDSVLAVLDLEIVFMLYDMEDSKAPIRSKYTQYKYPTKAVYRTKHNEHWDLLKELSGQGTTPEIPIPPVATISRNYPNPFNPSTTIEYSIPAASNVRLSIYNIKGQRVAELVNADLQKGHHKVVWNGKDSQNRNVSTGIYLIRMEANGKRATHKTMLMK